MSYQLSVISYQLSVISYKFLVRKIMKKSLLISMLLMIILLVVSCNDTTPTMPVITTNNDSTGIWPMRVGYTWGYNISYYNSKDSIYKQDNDTWTIILDTMMESDKAYLVESAQNKKNGISPHPFFIKPDGVYGYPLDTFNIQLWYKYPAKQNEKYLFGNDTIQVISINSSINVKAGKFNCIKYSSKRHYLNNSYDLDEDYFSPGLGKVFSRSTSYNNDTLVSKVEMELINYHLK